MTKQIKLAAYFPGVNNTTVWSDPAAGSQIDFASFEHLARTAERGKLDFLFLAEGLRLREHAGKLLDTDVVGRPNTTAVLAALSAVTTHLGLAGTLSSTFNEPYEVARQVASIDHLVFARDPGKFVHSGPQFDIHGEFTVPRTPQGQPVVIQAGDSGEGREFAAKAADVIFSRHGTLEDGQAFFHDVKRRLSACGREPGELLIMPAAAFVLGDTDAEAAERAREIRYQQVRPATAIQFLEQVWSRDLSGYDVDGPLPDIDPDPDAAPLTWGRVRHEKDPAALAAKWRALAEEKKLSIRELVIEATARRQFVGSPSTVAGAIDEYVQSDAADGFVLAPHLTPGGLDEFVEKVVPHLQERGVFRTEYAGPTLRDQLF